MENKLPLGICKQAILKYEAALADIHEIIEDEISDEQKETFQTIAEYTGNIIAHIFNEINQEMDENEFIAEQIEMDEIGEWPEENNDLMNELI